MLKQFLNSGSIKALMLYDGENDTGADAKSKLREQISKGNLPSENKVAVPDKVEKEEDKDGEKNEEGEDDEDDDGDGEKEEKEEVVELTPEQKAEKEAADKIAAKAKRKEDRVQKRINEIAASRDVAVAEVARLKAQLEANPEQKLTEAEIETRAEAIAAKKLADQQLKEVQENFEAACDKLQAAAKKEDNKFDQKINDIASDLGPIPSFIIGVLEDFDNGGEVLAFIANDDELAEKIWNLKNKPAKMTRELVEISNKLADEKKPKKKAISKVPDPVKPVNGSRTVSTALTEADAKDMPTYVAKRQAQIAEDRKRKGYH